MKRNLIIVLLLVLFSAKCLCTNNSYLNFTAVGGSATVSLCKHGTPYSASIQYSVDGCNTWNFYAFGNVINLSTGAKVYFKATSSNSKFGKDTKNNYYFVITGNVSADGNTMSLLDASMSQNSVPEYAFLRLFVNCSTMVKAPSLPATSLSRSCYSGMFKECTSLTQAPVLPATIMAENCYAEMFEGCSSLGQAPSLPATSLYAGCYSAMFSGCISLITAPNLPAGSLTECCYQSMFSGCTSLRNLPTLSATSLAQGCYKYMFRNCTSLTSATSLPATRLRKECYCGMFAGCSSLTTAPILSATTMAEQCCNNMFSNCVSLRQAPALPAMSLAIWCYMNMFSGCVSLTQVPELPATVMYDKCYKSMFYGCTSLKDIPELNATSLAKSCYQEMFKNCSSLKVNTLAPGKAWIIPGNATVNDDWNTDMFTGTAGTMSGTPQKGVCYYIQSDIQKYIITALSDDYSMGVVSGGGEYYEEDIATLVATPNQGYKFVKWNNGDRNATMNIKVFSDATYIAYFEPTVNSAVDNVKGAMNVVLYPNPVAPGDVACVNIETYEGAMVEVFTSDGLCVARKEAESSAVNIEGLNIAGIYFVKVTNKSGGISVTKLIVSGFLP